MVANAVEKWYLNLNVVLQWPLAGELFLFVLFFSTLKVSIHANESYPWVGDSQ